MNINFDPGNRQPKGAKGVFTQVLTVIVGVIVLGVAFMFSLVFFVVVAIAGLIFWLYFWWKTRALRKQMREHIGEQKRAQASEPPAAEPASSGDIIEGEAVRIDDERDQRPR